MLKNKLKTFFKNNFTTNPKTIAVAVSGGIDSLALTFLLNEFCVLQKIKLYAITVDHKMRKTSSNEALQLNKLLTKNKISHKILTINSKKIPQKNIEANLREVRYNLLYEYCTSQKIEHLFLAHHQNDAAENFLIRLFRGSQLDGLSKMQEVAEFKNIKLCRPLLTSQKIELEKYLKLHKIKHFEDESNEDEKFLRNKIRKFLASLEESELVQERIVKLSEILDENRQFIDEILLQKAREILFFQEEGAFLLNLEKYSQTSPKIALKILSLALTEIGGNIYKPRLEGLKNFENEILNLQKGKKKNFYGCMAKIINKDEMLAASMSASAGSIIKIYREEGALKKPSQKFDEKVKIIDGRFLQKNNAVRPYKFYFRTILKRIF